MKKMMLFLLSCLCFACAVNAVSAAGLPDAARKPKGLIYPPLHVEVSGYGLITSTDAQTTVSWASSPGARTYTVYWSKTKGVTKKSNHIKAVSPYVHSGLVYGQAYYYRVSASDDFKESELSRQEVSSIAKVSTTVRRQIAPSAISIPTALRPFDISSFSACGYGLWSYKPGVPYTKRLDLMSSTYVSTAARNSVPLLHFFAMTDIHITDKESPAEAMFFGLTSSGIISAYSPAMLYTTHMLDGAVRAINGLHKEKPFDFGISLGDAANSTQYNELRWFIDVLDGKVIEPSSGKHAGADKWGYQKPYKAAGLDRQIPWYSTLGNHDHFWMGSFPRSSKTRSAAIGSKVLNIGDIFNSTLGTASTGYYMGAVDGRTEFGTPAGAGPVEMFASTPTVVADANRRELNRTEWMNEFRITSSTPKGHGFSTETIKAGFACYTFRPKEKAPVKVIVLDDTQADSDPSDGREGPDWGHGSLDKTRYDWLVKQLNEGQKAGVLMIIAAHVPIGVSEPGSPEGWSPLAYVTESALLAKLKTYPNLLMWIAGHRHLNTITPMPSPDPNRPELGFWVVETSSLREFPQEIRTFNIERNSDDTVSIYVTNVDPIVDDSLAAVGRANAIAASQIFNDWRTSPSNAELLKQLSPDMQSKIRNYANPRIR